MRDVILDKLAEIEEKENVRILLAAESGSRAWGFASPDSDYDVRFLYVRRPECYLRLGKNRDVIEWQLDETLDINGWDLQKALRLLYSSNQALFEWANSPIIYKEHPLMQGIRELMEEYFSPKACSYHYLSMAKGNYSRMAADGTVKLKRYFYCLRPALAGLWILTKGAPPPVPFQELAEAGLPQELKGIVSGLIGQKSRMAESQKIPRIEALDRFIEAGIEYR